MTYRLPSRPTFVLTAIVGLLASTLLALSHPVQMMVDGQTIQSDVPPITTIGDKAYVPLRSIADALGATTTAHGNVITVVRGTQALHVIVGNRHATLDGIPLTFTKAPFRVRGRVMVSTRAIARAFRIYVHYNVRTARIDVITPGIGQANGATTAQTTQ